MSSSPGIIWGEDGDGIIMVIPETDIEKQSPEYLKISPILMPCLSMHLTDSDENPSVFGKNEPRLQRPSGPT